MKEENLNIEKRLEVLKNKEVFKVPENYFEDFAGRLKSRIAKESKAPVRISWIDYYLKPALSIAAVFAILFLAIYIPVNKTFNKGKTKIVQSGKPAKIENIQQSTEMGDSFEALTMLPQSQFLSTLEDVESQDEATAIDPKALEEYLADNSSDYDLFTNN